MHLEIVTPEHKLLSQDVDAITLPGTNGDFQLLNNHAPIVSTLVKGSLKIDKGIELNAKAKAIFKEENDKLMLDISGGVVECNGNKVIVLID